MDLLDFISIFLINEVIQQVQSWPSFRALWHGHLGKLEYKDSLTRSITLSNTQSPETKQIGEQIAEASVS